MSNNERIKINSISQVDSREKKVSLPINILVISKFANSDMNVFKVPNNNVNDLLKIMKPKLQLSISEIGDNELVVDEELCFQQINDFRPESIAMSIPQTRKLIGLRNILKLAKDKSLLSKDFMKTISSGCHVRVKS